MVHANAQISLMGFFIIHQLLELFEHWYVVIARFHHILHILQALMKRFLSAYTHYIAHVCKAIQ